MNPWFQGNKATTGWRKLKSATLLEMTCLPTKYGGLLMTGPFKLTVAWPPPRR